MNTEIRGRHYPVMEALDQEVSPAEEVKAIKLQFDRSKAQQRTSNGSSNLEPVDMNSTCKECTHRLWHPHGNLVTKAGERTAGDVMISETHSNNHSLTNGPWEYKPNCGCSTCQEHRLVELRFDRLQTQARTQNDALEIRLTRLETSLSTILDELRFTRRQVVGEEKAESARLGLLNEEVMEMQRVTAVPDRRKWETVEQERHERLVALEVQKQQANIEKEKMNQERLRRKAAMDEEKSKTKDAKLGSEHELNDHQVKGAEHIFGEGKHVRRGSY